MQQNGGARKHSSCQERLIVKVAVFRAAPNGRGATNLFADAFVRGAASAAETDDFDICAMDVSPCRGCKACASEKSGGCVLRDDMRGLLSAAERADAVAFFTPLYFGTMSAQLKAFFDRCFPAFCAAEKGAFCGKRALFWTAGGGRAAAFAAVKENFRLIAADLKMDLCANVARGESVYFSELGEGSVRVKKILAAAELLGAEFARGNVSEATVAAVESPIAPTDEAFEKRSKIYWSLLRGGKKF